MSSGSHAPRKPNVAAAPASLFKASSRFLHSGGRSGPAGTGGSGRGVKRQRAVAATLDSTECGNNIVEVSRCFAVGEHTDCPEGVKSKKRFVGVRQRPSGRWVAEIKDTTQKIRLWLGTFDSAEEGAKAYDNAARALRGANTRTNFLPVIACEGTVQPSKAARQVQLRQIAAASKACEKEAARNVAGDQPNVKAEPFQANTLPLVRQNLQHSISSLDSPAVEEDRTTSFLPSPKSARLPMGRRHNAPLASAKLEQVEVDVSAPAFHNFHTVIDPGTKSKLELVTSSPPKLERQQSVTSENLSIAISHSLTAGSSEQESSSSPGAFRLPSPRSPFECMEPTESVASGVVHSATNTFVDTMESHLSSFNQERFSTHRLESLAFPMESFVAPPPIPFVSTRQSLYPHHICGTNRDMYAEKDQEVVHADEENQIHVDMEMKCEAAVVKQESSMEFPSSERCFLTEREFVIPEPGVQELVLPDSPWPDYGLMDELEMDSSALLGLDLSNESSGVYKSPFDFSAEAIDRDSCTSGVLLEEQASKYFRVPYEQPQSPPVSQQDLQECVLLTEPPALDYSLSSHAPEPPPLSPWETTSSSLHWSLDDTTTTSTWDGHSSSSTTDVKPETSSDASGECLTSQDHEALWSSMDLPPLCMVA